MKENISSRLFQIFNTVFILIICTLILIPIWMVVITSISPDNVVAESGFVMIPKGIDLTAYKRVLTTGRYFQSFINSVWITIVATAVSMLLTATMAYALAQRKLIFRKFFMKLVMLTMIVDGGIIPFYMVVRTLGLMDSYAALIIPMAISTYNLVLMRNFFLSIPESLLESARLDGCGEMRILLKIVLPVSVPIIAAVTLFYAVIHWNRYFETVMFINSSSKMTLQVLLRQLIFQAEADGAYTIILNNFKMAVMVVAMVPVLLIYPFVQKYFISGIMIGSVKE